MQEHLTAIQLAADSTARWDNSWLALLALRNCQTALDGDPALAAEIATALVSGGLLVPLMEGDRWSYRFTTPSVQDDRL